MYNMAMIVRRVSGGPQTGSRHRLLRYIRIQKVVSAPKASQVPFPLPILPSPLVILAHPKDAEEEAIKAPIRAASITLDTPVDKRPRALAIEPWAEQ